mmetsp:Transcript_4075/g.8215  ORF Transcript_4075/g.8215 Transcript_4075/m.8215 type:complete len:82 (-) Transcript_4075:492-737(-)
MELRENERGDHISTHDTPFINDDHLVLRYPAVCAWVASNDLLRIGFFTLLNKDGVVSEEDTDVILSEETVSVAVVVVAVSS